MILFFDDYFYNSTYLFTFNWKVILCPTPADCFGQQLCNDQNHSESLLLHESSNTLENQKTVPF